MNSEEQGNALNGEVKQISPAEQRGVNKRRLLIGAGVAVLVLLLAAAAFVGGRLLNGQGLPGVSSGGPSLFMGGGNGKNSVRVDLGDIQPAKELPQTPADVRGLFDHRQDNSIFVGTGQVTMSLKKDASGNVETSSSHDGPTVEVVVSAQTTIYQDVTMKQFNGPPPQGQKIQQVLEPGSLDDVGQNSTVMVWGRKTGDRFIADVLVYSPPAFFTK